MKNITFYILILLLINTIASAQSITFNVQDLEAGPADANWMFGTDDIAFPTDDGNPFTYSGNVPVENFAYRNFTWKEGQSSGTCSEENLSVLAGTANVTLKLYGFSLKSFHHINTENSNNNWNISGQAGDERVYAGGTGEIYVDGSLKLKVTNCRLSVSVCYPTAAQMNLIDGVAGFLNDVGSGAASTGSGWGVIDTDNSDAAWVSEFDPHGTGQIDFDISTISAVIQGTYGYYDFDILVKPAPYQELMNFAAVAGTGELSLPESSVAFNLSAYTAGTGSMQDLFANRIMTNSGGALPAEISTIYEGCYWQLGTTCGTFNTSVTFDISDISGISDPSKLRILKRNNETADWEIYGSYTLVDPTHIRADNVTSFSEFAISSVDSNPLPVELVSFTAERKNSSVLLKWNTAGETNNLGFEIQRNIGEGWKKIAFVKGAGNSNSPIFYSFTDDSPIAEQNIIYRLKQVDLDGKYSYSKEIVVETQGNTSVPAEYSISQNYPNPFNPSTTIEFSLPKDSEVTLKIYNLLGQEAASLISGKMDSGFHTIKFNAAGLPSGIYLYKITALSLDGNSNFNCVKRLMLVK